jgi:iron complex transport system permease protein
MIRPAHWWLLGLLALVTAAAFLAALVVGSTHLPAATALRALMGGGDALARTIVQTVRLPRALAALSVGSLLALAGVLLQALFRNPLADPYVLGVSGGAAVGALGALLLGAGLATARWCATAGGLLVGLAALLLSRGGGSPRLLLCGVVLASACGAMVTVLLALGDSLQVRGMVFWLAGDLSWAQHPLPNLLAVLVALAGALAGGRVLNVLGSGELRSATVGLGGRTHVLVFIVSAALTALAVVSAGTVGFVGLMAPHLARTAFRSSDHRIVAPAAVLAGGALLCIADIVGRTVVAPRELPVGAVTALIGAPLFLALLLRSQTRRSTVLRRPRT